MKYKTLNCLTGSGERMPLFDKLCASVWRIPACSRCGCCSEILISGFFWLASRFWQWLLFFGGFFEVWVAVVLRGRLVLRRGGWCGSGVVVGVAVRPPAESFLIDIRFCLTAVEDFGMPLVWLLSEICS
ncbi:hypothetical protein RHGRI_026063 [Rhododendron griersonianum]|uniref:Uncharacterized protein n=1 Tax=Rhododendron griersonianum TaxID=479676 RepID=A0AAV6IXI7_9ERIC|nr:hypothetical protein RHGRI_026063 [Rhododendron griersonianum]